MHIFYSFIFVLSQAAGLDWNKKKSNSNDEAGKQTIGKKIWILKSKQLSNEGLQNGWWLTTWICQNAKKKLRVQQSSWNISGSKNKMVASLIQCLQNQKFQNFFSSEVEKIVKFWMQWSSKIQKQNITFWSTRGPLAARAQSVDSSRFVKTIGKGFHPKG